MSPQQQSFFYFFALLVTEQICSSKFDLVQLRRHLATHPKPRTGVGGYLYSSGCRARYRLLSAFISARLMFGGTVPEQRLQPADRKEHSDTSSQKSGRGASRGRGRGRGRSTGRGRGQPSGSVRADHQAGQGATAPAPTAGAAQQATSANERRGRSRRGRGQPPLGSAAPPGHAVTFGDADPSVQRQPRPRARPQHRHSAAHHFNQHTEATGRHRQTQEQQLPTHAAADQAQSVLSGPECVVCCEPIQVTGAKQLYQSASQSVFAGCGCGQISHAGCSNWQMQSQISM